MRAHLQNFVDAYNFARRLKTLRVLTPYEFICKDWTSEPQIQTQSAPANAGTKHLGVENDREVEKPARWWKRQPSAPSLRTSR